MNWMEEAAARWSHILAASGPGDVTFDEAVRLISEVGGPSARQRRFRRARPSSDPEVRLAAVLSSYLIISLLASDLLVEQLCAVTDRTREQVVAEMSGRLLEQVRDGQIEARRLSEIPWIARELTHPTYAGLGTRIEQLLRLAEQQASAIVDEARA